MLRVRIEADPARLPRQADLDELFAQTTRARVLACGVEDGKAQGGPVVAEAAATELPSLRDALEIREGGETFHCMCRGDLAIELLGPLGRIATLGAHHGMSVRLDAWSADADLVDGERLFVWLARRGAPEFLAEYRRAAVRAREMNNERRRWLAAMPEAVAPFLPTLEADGLPVYGNAAYQPPLDALIAEAGSSEAAIVALLSWLGAGIGPWAGSPAYEGVALTLLELCDYDAVLGTLDRVIDSPRALVGAARFVAMSTRTRRRKERTQLLDDRIVKALLAGAEQLGIVDNVARLEAALSPPVESSLPPGLELVGRASERLRGIAVDAQQVFVVDGTNLSRFVPGSPEPVVLLNLGTASPLVAARGWVFAQRGGEVIRLPSSGGRPESIGQFGARTSSWRVAGEHLYCIRESQLGSEPAASVVRLPMAGGEVETTVEPIRGAAWDLCVRADATTWVRSRLERRLLRGQVRRMSVERHRGSGQEELGRFDISGERMIRLAESNDGTTWWTDSDKQLATCCRDGRSTRIALGGRPTQIVAGTDAHVVVDDDGEQELFRMAPGGITERWALGRLQHVVEVTLDDNVAYATLDGAVVRVGDRGVPLAEAT